MARNSLLCADVPLRNYSLTWGCAIPWNSRIFPVALVGMVGDTWSPPQLGVYNLDLLVLSRAIYKYIRKRHSMVAYIWQTEKFYALWDCVLLQCAVLYCLFVQ